MSSPIRLLARIAAVMIAVGGVVAMVAGGIAWNMTSSELAAQKINVAAEGESPRYAGSPFDAFTQVDLIKEHTAAGIVKMGFPEGTVYTDVEMPDAAKLGACKAIAAPDRSDDCVEMVRNDSARAYFDNSNFKQASLYTSVLAFGTSAILVALGLALVVISALFLLLLSRGAKRTVAQN